MRITCVLPTLRCGGTERVVTTLANAWSGQGKRVTLLTLDDAPPCWPLAPGVGLERLTAWLPELAGRPRPAPWPALGPRRRFAGAGDRELALLAAEHDAILALRRAVAAQRPDLVLSFIYKANVRTLLAAAGGRMPVVICERSDPHHLGLGERGWEELRRRTYPLATRLVALTPAARDYFARQLGVPAAVIPNPVPPPPPEEATRPRRRGRTLVAVGRLVPIKGFDLLLAAFARVAPRHPDWTLEIHGEGDERPRLEAAAARLGLGGRAILPGFARHPHAVLRRADLFVLTSLAEGFPNALCEALACGLPAVCFDCPSGPRHIVRHGADGVLVPAGDVAGLARALDHLFGDDAARRRLAARAPEILERFSLERILGLWQGLFDRLPSPRDPRPAALSA
ncbi:MAG: glycosyltransferase family 4 protein [Acidobacteria bacterium]|nr:MAG: glycosyltransferase family 4 protein [Acidobacteriota bacterium]